MFVRKLYVPTSCIQGDIMAMYILWPSDRKIIIRVTIPDSLEIHEVFNAELDSGMNTGELNFSRFVVNGYLGITFKAQFIGNTPTPVKMEFVFEDESGMGEAHEKTVLLIPSGINESYSNMTIRFHSDVEALERKLVKSPPLGAPEGKTLLNDPEEKKGIAAILEKIFTKLDQISHDLEDEFQIEGRALTILCPERKFRYDQVIYLKKSRPLPKTVKFTHIIPSRVELTRLANLTSVPESVVYTDDGYKIKLNFLSSGERVLLSLEYSFEDADPLLPLIQKGCSINVPIDSTNETIRCDISVQVKYLDLLIREGCEVNLHDLEMCLEILFEQGYGSNTPDHSKTSDARFSPAYHMSASTPSIGIISESSNIQTSIEVRRDFTFHTASLMRKVPERSITQSHSQSMKLFVRTDLQSGKPAADVSIVLKWHELL